LQSKRKPFTFKVPNAILEIILNITEPPGMHTSSLETGNGITPFETGKLAGTEEHEGKKEHNLLICLFLQTYSKNLHFELSLFFILVAILFLHLP